MKLGTFGGNSKPPYTISVNETKKSITLTDGYGSILFTGGLEHLGMAEKYKYNYEKSIEYGPCLKCGHSYSQHSRFVPFGACDWGGGLEGWCDCEGFRSNSNEGDFK